MGGKFKKYNGTFGLWHTVIIGIDHTVMSDDKLHEINNFWSNPQERLSASKGDVTKAVLKMLCAEILRLSLSTTQVKDCFDWKSKRGVEGWPSMDGSEGIKIVSFDSFSIDSVDIDVEVVE